MRNHQQTKSKQTFSRRRIAVAVSLMALAMAATAYLALSHWDAVTGAISSIPIALLVCVLVLQIIVLVLRLEAWRLCLRAAGAESLTRGEIYSAGAVSFPLSIVNLQLSSAVRLGALRKIAPTRSPRVGALIAAELPVFGTELLFGAVLLCLAAPALGIPFWVAPALFSVMLGVLALLRALGQGSGFARGFAILGEVRRARRLAGLVSLLVLAQVARIWVLLMAAGLAVSPLDASAVLVGQGVLSQLPVGAAASSGASLMALSSHGVGAATAAGLALSATEITAAVCFFVFALPLALPILKRLLGQMKEAPAA